MSYQMERWWYARLQWKNIFFDEDRTRIMRPLQERDLSQKFGTKYGVQKNRMNGQIILYTRVVYHPKYCPVVLGLNIVADKLHTCHCHNIGLYFGMGLEQHNVD